MKKWICAAIAAALVFPTVIPAAEPVKIGFIFTLSDRLSFHGSLAKQGAELALAQINDAGGIGGRKVVGVFEDDGSDPRQGAEKARGLVEKEKVDAIIGITHSGVAIEVSRVAHEAKVPLIVTQAQTPAITGSKCNPYTFRVCRTSDGMMRTAAAAAERMSVKTWTTVGPDYLFGYECWDSFKKYLSMRQPGVRFVPADRVAYGALDNVDWTSQIEKIKGSGADGVLITLYAGNLIDFLKQAREHEFFDGKRSVIACLGSVSTLLTLGVEMPEGVWMTPPYWFRAENTPINERFVKAYMNRYRTPPDYQAQFAYAGVKAYAAAARRAESTDKASIVGALRGMELDLPVGPVVIRREDHQAVFAVYAGVTGDRVTMVEGAHRRLPCRLLERGFLIQADQVAGIPEESGCAMSKP